MPERKTMDFPQTFLGWVNLFAFAWAVAAYATAAIAGVRALTLSYQGPPASPLCLIADATRWVFGIRMSTAGWRPSDFMVLGVALAVLACLIGVVSTADFLVSYDWRKLGRGESLVLAGGHIIAGSALILLHCSAALRLKAGGGE
jgi:hypothetical protein